MIDEEAEMRIVRLFNVVSVDGYFGSVDAEHLLEDPYVVIQGDRVLHLRSRVRWAMP